MKDSTKDYIFRIIKTFFEAFIPAFLVALKTYDGQSWKTFLTVVVIPSAAAAISAMLNVNKIKDGDTE